MPEEKKEEIKSKPAFPVFLNKVIDEKGKASVIAGGPSAPAFNSKKGEDMVAYQGV